MSTLRTDVRPARSAPHPSSRRSFLGLAAALGTAGLSACATGGAHGGADSESSGAPTSQDNPFGVDGGEFSAFVFDGGDGVKHLDFTQELFEEKRPEVTTKIVRAEDLSTLQPQFVNQTPPDLFQNSGAGSLDVNSLATNQQLASLDDLMAAPSWDDPSITVEESLNPGVREAGTVGDQLVGLNTTQYAWAIWHDAALFADKGWEMPRTWDELMALSATIKADGIYPWAFTGMHANYFEQGVFQPLVAKIGGQEVWRNVDNLEDGAWQQDAIREAAEAVLQLRTDELILPGVAQMTHIQSQTSWLNHEAAFIPVGAWLENEMKSAIPEGFELTATALPAPEESLADLTPNNPGGGWYVPADASNRPAAFEFLRALLSRESAQNSAELTNAVTMVKGAHDDPGALPGVLDDHHDDREVQCGRGLGPGQIRLLVPLDGRGDPRGAHQAGAGRSRRRGFPQPMSEEGRRDEDRRRDREADALMHKRGQWRLIVTFTVPGLVLYTVFVLSSFAQGVQISFTDWTGFTPDLNYIGFDNYLRLVHDGSWWRSVLHNGILLVVIPVLTLGLAMLFASLITRGGAGNLRATPGGDLYRILFFFPQVVPVVIIGILFSYLYASRGGLLQGVLDVVGLDMLSIVPNGPLGNPRTILLAIAVAAVWSSVGFYMVLFLSAMGRVPDELYEAAALDGAGRLGNFVHVTMPLIWAHVQTAFIYLAIGTIDSFALVAVMSQTGAAADFGADVMSTYLYRTAFSLNSQFGYAATMGTVMMIGSVALALVTFRLTKREEYEY